MYSIDLLVSCNNSDKLSHITLPAVYILVRASLGTGQLSILAIDKPSVVCENDVSDQSSPKTRSTLSNVIMFNY